MIYEVSYFTDDEWCGTVCQSFCFKGTYDELQDKIKRMREMDCYNFSVSAIDENGERW